MELFLGLAVLLGLIPALVAKHKGRSFVGWWVYGALLFVFALPHALLLNRAGSMIVREGDHQAGRRDRPSGDKIWFSDVDPDPAWRRLVTGDQNLVGERFHRSEILAFAAGTAQAVEVVREPDNPHATAGNALAIFGSWEEASGPRRALLGYVPNELSARIAAERPADLPIRAYPLSLYRRDKYLDLKVVLLEPSARSAWWRERGLSAPPRIPSF